MYTPTEKKILAVLSDGLPHDKEEMRACLFDPMGSTSNLAFHMFNLRRKLRPIGQDIVTEMGRSFKLFYRHVRLLTSPYNE